MNKIFRKFIKGVKEIKLSDSEKSVLRSKISEFISFNPIRDNVSMPKSKNYISIFTVQHFVKGVAFLLVVAIVAGGSGVSYAASSSLPGDKLYNIKVNVNEKIEESLAITPEAKAAVKSKKVERRLEETQTLVKTNKLNETSKKIVEEKLEKHIEELSREIENLKETGEIDIVLETTAKLTPVLEAHKDKLIEANIKETETLLEKVESTIKNVEEEEKEIISEVEDKEEAIETKEGMESNTEEDQKVDEALEESKEELEEISERISSLVESRIESAEDKLSNLKKDFESVKTDIAKIEEKKPVEQNMLTEAEVEAQDNPTEDLTEKVEVVETKAVNSLMQRAIAPEEKDASISAEAEIPETSAAKEKIEEEFPEITEEELEETTLPSFEVKDLIRKVDSLLREANELWSRNKFRSALEKAQEANKLISEIEIKIKLQELEIAKIIKVNQKAESLQSIQ